MPFNIFGANSVSGYTVKNSLRFNSGSTDYLNRTPASAGSRQKWVWSGWVKRSKLGSEQVIFAGYAHAADRLKIFFDSNDKLNYLFYNNTTYTIITTRVFRDVSAWYHIVVITDTTNATTNDRFQFYINGTRESALDTNSQPTQNLQMTINDTSPHFIGQDGNSGGYFNGYISEINFINNQSLDATSFGETDTDSGIWKPKAYTGTYGTNGFYLKFANSASLGTDSSGNGNNFTVNNLTSIDQTTDTPTNNFCTMNPLDQNGGMTFTDGNLSTASTSASWRSTRGTFGITQGKWFFEVKAVNTGGALLDMMVGIADFSLAIPSEFSSSNPALTYTAGSGNKQLNGVNSSYGATYNVGDIIGVAFDADNLTVTFYKNGTSQGTITTSWSSGLTWTPAISLYGRYSNTQASFNFGNPPYSANSYADANGFGNFSYSVPSGYYALCTKNLYQYGF